ncbi:LOW QUALITY PROTEIN: aarF domain-containing protein kinase 1 [Ascaphus truei]|uniref:LOW QUALITY PROTEIN: aarF domain-containing protein kinase 1 n=1 Tax=Ascaphus truei TaxID=8439 RepID=UPI003F5A82D2
MVRGALRLASVASVALASSGVFLYGTRYLDPNDFGVVRIGRAVLTTAAISFDYLSHLQHVPAGTPEYDDIRSQACEIRSNAAAYLPQISQLLASVPRQMLLLLKTNDLLRGIETSLRTRASASSFISMSRCCVRGTCQVSARSRHRKDEAVSFWSFARISFSESLHLGQLGLYEIILRVQASSVGAWVRSVFCWVHLYLH